jgi:hypothetical protein
MKEDAVIEELHSQELFESVLYNHASLKLVVEALNGITLSNQIEMRFLQETDVKEVANRALRSDSFLELETYARNVQLILQRRAALIIFACDFLQERAQLFGSLKEYFILCEECNGKKEREYELSLQAEAEARELLRLTNEFSNVLDEVQQNTSLKAETKEALNELYYKCAARRYSVDVNRALFAQTRSGSFYGKGLDVQVGLQTRTRIEVLQKNLAQFRDGFEYNNDLQEIPQISALRRQLLPLVERVETLWEEFQMISEDRTDLTTAMAFHHTVLTQGTCRYYAGSEDPDLIALFKQSETFLKAVAQYGLDVDRVAGMKYVKNAHGNNSADNRAECWVALLLPEHHVPILQATFETIQHLCERCESLLAEKNPSGWLNRNVEATNALSNQSTAAIYSSKSKWTKFVHLERKITRERLMQRQQTFRLKQQDRLSSHRHLFDINDDSVPEKHPFFTSSVSLSGDMARACGNSQGDFENGEQNEEESEPSLEAGQVNEDEEGCIQESKLPRHVLLSAVKEVDETGDILDGNAIAAVLNDEMRAEADGTALLEMAEEVRSRRIVTQLQANRDLPRHIASTSPLGTSYPSCSKNNAVNDDGVSTHHYNYNDGSDNKSMQCHPLMRTASFKLDSLMCRLSDDIQQQELHPGGFEGPPGTTALTPEHERSNTPAKGDDLPKDSGQKSSPKNMGDNEKGGRGKRATAMQEPSVEPAPVLMRAFPRRESSRRLLKGLGGGIDTIAEENFSTAGKKPNIPFVGLELLVGKRNNGSDSSNNDSLSPACGVSVTPVAAKSEKEKESERERERQLLAVPRLKKKSLSQKEGSDRRKESLLRRERSLDASGLKKSRENANASSNSGEDEESPPKEENLSRFTSVKDYLTRKNSNSSYSSYSSGRGRNSDTASPDSGKGNVEVSPISSMEAAQTVSAGRSMTRRMSIKNLNAMAGFAVVGERSKQIPIASPQSSDVGPSPPTSVGAPSLPQRQRSQRSLLLLRRNSKSTLLPSLGGEKELPLIFSPKSNSSDSDISHASPPRMASLRRDLTLKRLMRESSAVNATAAKSTEKSENDREGISMPTQPDGGRVLPWKSVINKMLESRYDSSESSPSWNEIQTARFGQSTRYIHAEGSVTTRNDEIWSPQDVRNAATAQRTAGRIKIAAPRKKGQLLQRNASQYNRAKEYKMPYSTSGRVIQPWQGDFRSENKEVRDKEIEKEIGKEKEKRSIVVLQPPEVAKPGRLQVQRSQKNLVSIPSKRIPVSNPAVDTANLPPALAKLFATMETRPQDKRR